MTLLTRFVRAFCVAGAVLSIAPDLSLTRYVAGCVCLTLAIATADQS